MKTKEQKDKEFEEMLEEQKPVVKKSLFGYGEDLTRIMESIELNDGEITADISEALALTEKDVKNKTTGYVSYMSKLDSEIVFIDAEIKRLQQWKKVNTNKKERLKDALKSFMLNFGWNEIKTNLNKINFRKSETLTIDLDKLPKEYTIIEVKPISKTELKKLIKAGKTIPGVELVTNQEIQIK